MTEQELIERIFSLSALWNEAEESVKEAELSFPEHAIVRPAINELRYAGRQMVDAITVFRTDSTSPEIEKHLAKTEGALLNAEHDAVDASFGFYAMECNRMREQVGIVNARKHFADYDTLFSLIKRMNRDIQNSRNDRTKRVLVYKSLRGDVRKLGKLYDKFFECVDAIEEERREEEEKRREEEEKRRVEEEKRRVEEEKRRVEERRKERKSTYFALAGLGVAVATAVATLITILQNMS